MKWPSASTGSQWSPGLLDRAELFDGSDGETVTTTNTRASGGQLELGAGGTGTTLSTSPSRALLGYSDSGVMIVPNAQLEGFEVTLMSNPGSGVVEYEAIRLYDADGGLPRETLGETTGTFTPGDTVKVESSKTLQPGEPYAVAAIHSPNGEDTPTNSNVTFPYSSGDFDITNGFKEGSANSYDWMAFSDVTALKPATSGSATVSWPMPDDLAGWDIIPFGVTADGATVEVYAIDSNGNRLQGPLTDPADISDLSRSTNVGVEVVLERPSTAENPRLESVYRRRKIT